MVPLPSVFLPKRYTYLPVLPAFFAALIGAAALFVVFTAARARFFPAFFAICLLNQKVRTRPALWTTWNLAAVHSVTISEISAISRINPRSDATSPRRVARTRSSSAITSTSSKNFATAGCNDATPANASR